MYTHIHTHIISSITLDQSAVKSLSFTQSIQTSHKYVWALLFLWDLCVCLCILVNAICMHAHLCGHTCLYMNMCLFISVWMLKIIVWDIWIVFSLCVVYRVSERARSARQWCLMTLVVLLWSQKQTNLCEFNP